MQTIDPICNLYIIEPYKQTTTGIQTMSKRRKAAQRKAAIKSTVLQIAALAAFGLWAVGAQLMLQGAL